MGSLLNWMISIPDLIVVMFLGVLLVWELLSSELMVLFHPISEPWTLVELQLAMNRWVLDRSASK
jgi:hypothetical protein